MYYYMRSWTTSKAQKPVLGATHPISIRRVCIGKMSRKLQFGIVFVQGIYQRFIGPKHTIFTPEHTHSPLLNIAQGQIGLRQMSLWLSLVLMSILKQRLCETNTCALHTQSQYMNYYICLLPNSCILSVVARMKSSYFGGICSIYVSAG